MPQRIENYPKYAIHLVVLLLLQIFVFDRLAASIAIPKIHAYIVFILILPASVNRVALLLMAFGLGLFVDNFDHTLGVNAAAATFSAYIKPYVASVLVHSRTVEIQLRLAPTVSDYGLGKLMRFLFVLLIAHFLFYYFFEAFSFVNFWYIVGKALYSCLLSFVFVFIYNILFNNK